MATLADTLAAKSRTPGIPCRLGTWITAQPDDMRTDVLGAFRTRAVSGQALADWFKTQQVDTDSNAVNKHRRGHCAWCARADLDYKVTS